MHSIFCVSIHTTILMAISNYTGLVDWLIELRFKVTLDKYKSSNTKKLQHKINRDKL